MILHPCSPAASAASEVVPAWKAVFATQEQPAPAWWLITQPDHAALAGALAAQFAAPEFPRLDHDVVRAIALHDSGWAKYDGGGPAGTPAGGSSGIVPLPPRDASGRPLSFLDTPVSIFVEAWSASVQYAAEEAGPVGGLMVSGHFRRLGEHRLASVDDLPEDAARVRAFVENETRQDEARFAAQPRPRPEVERLIDVLQFCDLLSLYLCCGSRANVQFPQELAGRPIVLRRSRELCRLEPSPFHEEVSLGVPARRDPVFPTEPNACVLPVLLR